jgi:hypothetical protein
MNYSNLSYVNAAGGISAQIGTEDDYAYFEPDSPTAELLRTGAYGDIAPYVERAPLPPSSGEVNTERDRRINVGDTFTLTSGAVVPIKGDDVTIRNLQSLAQMAMAGLSTTFPFRDAEDVIHQLTADDITELWAHGTTFVSSVFQAAWTLKDNAEGIPFDYEDDKYWP